MPSSIKDIAKKLNVSVSTVSYALNGGPRVVSPELKDRILDAARAMNYRPNRVARSMVTRRSKTIGIVPPEANPNVFLSPYLQVAMNGIANEAARLHQDILVFTRCNDTEREEILDTILDGRVDGVLFVAPGLNLKAIEVATSVHLPCAMLSGAPIDGLLSFSVNNDLGVYQAMEHLFELGHRRIAHIGGRSEMQDALVRTEAYRRFLTDHNLPIREEWIRQGRFVRDGGFESMVDLMSLPEKPSAVFCANDEMAVGALLAAKSLGISVPSQVSIVGFDGVEAGLQVDPPITTVSQPIGDAAVHAVRALVDLIEGRWPEPKFVFDTVLVKRASATHPMKELS